MSACEPSEPRAWIKLSERQDMITSPLHPSCLLDGTKCIISTLVDLPNTLLSDLCIFLLGLSTASAEEALAGLLRINGSAHTPGATALGDGGLVGVPILLGSSPALNGGHAAMKSRPLAASKSLHR